MADDQSPPRALEFRGPGLCRVCAPWGVDTTPWSTVFDWPGHWVCNGETNIPDQVIEPNYRESRVP